MRTYGCVDDDEYLYYAEAAVKGTTQVASPGSAFVDFLPFSECRSCRRPGDMAICDILSNIRGT